MRNTDIRAMYGRKDVKIFSGDDEDENRNRDLLKKNHCSLAKWLDGRLRAPRAVGMGSILGLISKLLKYANVVSLKK